MTTARALQKLLKDIVVHLAGASPATTIDAIAALRLYSSGYACLELAPRNF
jgi:hypothetical protein